MPIWAKTHLSTKFVGGFSTHGLTLKASNGGGGGGEGNACAFGQEKEKIDKITKILCIVTKHEANKGWNYHNSKG
jgi:hypothetical protein